MGQNLGLFFNVINHLDEIVTTFEMEHDPESKKTEKEVTYDNQTFNLAVIDDLVYCNGNRLFVGTSELQKPVLVTVEDEDDPDKPKYHMTLKVKLPTPAVRVHPDGKQCGQCKMFSPEQGKEILNEITHRYQDNLNMRMSKVIVDHVASQHGCPTLTEADAGYCPKERELCGKQSPGCSKWAPVIKPQG